MMKRIPRPDLKKRFLCTICKAGTCELIVENYDKSPTFCPYDKELRKWEEVPEGAKNTDIQSLEAEKLQLAKSLYLAANDFTSSNGCIPDWWKDCKEIARKMLELESAKNTEQQVRTRTKPEEQMEFEKELEMLINKHSKENESDTPDFILAQYLKGCMTVYAETIKARDKWYGFKGLSERSSDI